MDLETTEEEFGIDGTGEAIGSAFMLIWYEKVRKKKDHGSRVVFCSRRGDGQLLFVGRIITTKFEDLTRRVCIGIDGTVEPSDMSLV